MERGFQREFGIMQPIGIELHLGAAGASAKEVHRAALAHHVDRPLPRLRTAHCFDHYIAATLLG